MLNSVRKEIWAVDRGVALSDIGTLDEYLKRFSYAEPRFSLILLGVFAGVGLVLVAIGVYSVIAYTVSRQIHEIGIRMALGARRGDVLKLVIAMTLRLVLIGVVLGLFGSLGVMKVLASQIWGISPRDVPGGPGRGLLPGAAGDERRPHGRLESGVSPRLVRPSQAVSRARALRRSCRECPAPRASRHRRPNP
jgi:hypothetical protein